MEGARRAIAVVDLPKQQEVDTTATAVVAAAEEKEEKEAAGMKRKLAKTGFKSPYDSDYDDDEPYEYNSGDDVEDDNKESFIEKEAQKIREKGKAAYFRRGMFRSHTAPQSQSAGMAFMNT
ncbi:PAX-interacting protein 1 [Hordeum vulgare]|nr:PAX-interacting protein 1 [Hordeum vulgare]